MFVCEELRLQAGFAEAQARLADLARSGSLLTAAQAASGAGAAGVGAASAGASSVGATSAGASSVGATSAGASSVGATSVGATSASATGLARVGPLGPVRGLSRVVQVQFRDPVVHGDAAHLALRWEAAGPGGSLFPALDADITLTAAGDQATLLVLAGVYRPPLGSVGVGLDQAILHHLALATIRDFLCRLGDIIVAAGAPLHG